MLIKSGVAAENEDSEMKELLSYSGISSASFSSAVIESFNNMIKSINYIVLVLILSAGMLAFVVLYNLTNINISERVKEIATIKVLGFYDREVNSYVCRETYILSAIGTAVGLVLGILLCRFICAYRRNRYSNVRAENIPYVLRICGCYNNCIYGAC